MHTPARSRRRAARSLAGLLLLGTLSAHAGDRESLEAEIRVQVGIVWLEQGDLDKAAERFAQALELDPDNGEAHHYAGVVAERRGRWEESKRHFRQARALGYGRPGGGSSAGSSEVDLPKLTLSGSLGVELDGNVTSANPEFVLDQDSVDPISDESDERGAASFRLGIYPWSNGTWTLGLGLDAYASRHSSLSTYDLLGPTASIGVSYGRDATGVVGGLGGVTRVPSQDPTRAVVALRFGLGNYWLDGDSYLASRQLSGTVRIRENDRAALQIDLALRDGDFDEFEARSGSYLQGRIAQSFRLGDGHRVLRFGVGTASNDADELDVVTPSAGGLSDDYDYDQVELFADLSVALPHDIGLFVQASMRQQDYDNVNSNAVLAGDDGATVREDDRTSLSAALVWAFHGHVRLVGRYSRIDNGSNIDFYDYDRDVASLGLSFSY